MLLELTFKEHLSVILMSGLQGSGKLLFRKLANYLQTKKKENIISSL
jgi:signal recognition particle GTPase